MHGVFTNIESALTLSNIAITFIYNLLPGTVYAIFSAVCQGTYVQMMPRFLSHW